MDRKQLCNSLITWLGTFDITASHNSVEELSDGVAMAQVLNQIAPNFFDSIWMTKLKTDSSTNWRLKVNNLKKILKGVLDYNMDILGLQIQDFQMPDVNAIGEHNNSEELGRLLQLILGCAVNCDEKQEYIQRIMAMEESVQHMVMNAIQELMTKERSTSSTEGYTELSDQLKRTTEELNNATEAKKDLMQRCQELDMQVASLSEERANLATDNDRLTERLHQSECLDDPSTLSGRRYQQLQHQVDQYQEEMFKLETGRDDFRIKYEVISKDYADLQQKNSDLASQVDESRQLKDELDVLRHTSDQVMQYESTIEVYRKKLDELSDLRGQNKLLEENTTKYMEKNMELEEEVRKTGSVKQQLELYKRQVHEHQNRISDETKRADKAEFEFKRVQEKMISLQREKDRITKERDSLKEMNDELRCTQVQGAEFSSPGLATAGQLSSSPEMLSLPPDIKEKLIRLQHENKMLKLSKSGSEEEQSPVLMTMLDDANLRKNELETELRIANQRILELAAQIEDIHESQQTSSSQIGSAEIRKKLNEQSQKISRNDIELINRQNAIEDLECKVKSSMDEIHQLQEQLKRKDDDAKKMEERYKRYLEKAKHIIKTLDPKQNAGSAPEYQAIRNSLHEKQRLIEHLEKDGDRARAIREQQEKLVVSAWYNLGMQLHRQTAFERLSNNSAGQSFLARQRKTHTRRAQTVTTLQTNSR